MTLSQVAIEELKALKGAYDAHMSDVEYIIKNKDNSVLPDSMLDANKHMLWAMASWGQMAMWVMDHYAELIETLDASIDVSPEEA